MTALVSASATEPSEAAAYAFQRLGNLLRYWQEQLGAPVDCGSCDRLLSFDDPGPDSWIYVIVTAEVSAMSL